MRSRISGYQCARNSICSSGVAPSMVDGIDGRAGRRRRRHRFRPGRLRPRAGRGGGRDLRLVLAAAPLARPAWLRTRLDDLLVLDHDLPVEVDVGILALDLAEDLRLERLASDAHAARRAEDVQDARPLAIALAVPVHQIRRLVSAFVANDAEERHGGATCVSVRAPPASWRPRAARRAPSRRRGLAPRLFEASWPPLRRSGEPSASSVAGARRAHVRLRRPRAPAPRRAGRRRRRARRRGWLGGSRRPRFRFSGRRGPRCRLDLGAGERCTSVNRIWSPNALYAQISATGIWRSAAMRRAVSMLDAGT